MWPADHDLKSRLPHPANEELIAYLQGEAPGATVDLLKEVELAATGLSDANEGRGEGALSYCPDRAGSAYLVLYSPAGIIYGLAEGDGRLVLRLPNEMEPPALGDAAYIHAILSDATKTFWAAFPVFAEDTIDRDQDEAREVIKTWLQRARDFAG